MITDVKIKGIKLICITLFNTIVCLMLCPIEKVWMAIARLFEKIGLISLSVILYEIHWRYCDWYEERFMKKMRARYEDFRSDVYVISGVRLKEFGS